MWVGPELPPIPEPLKVELKVAELSRYYLTQDSLRLMVQLGNPEGVIGAAAGQIGGNFLAGEFKLAKGKEYTDYHSSKLGIDWGRAIGPMLGDLDLGYERNSYSRVWEGLGFGFTLTSPTRWGEAGVKTEVGWARLFNQEFLSYLTDLELQFRSSLGDWGLKGIYGHQGLLAQKPHQLYIEVSDALADGSNFIKLSAGYEPILREPSFRGEFGTGRAPLWCWLGVDYTRPIPVRFDTLYRSAAPMEFTPGLELPRCQQGVDLNLSWGPAQGFLFYQKVASLIYWDDIDQDSLIGPANSDATLVGTGFNLMIELPHLENWTGLTYQLVEPELPLRPRFLLQDSLTLLWQGFWFKFSYTICSARYLSDHRLEPYNLFSSRLGWGFKGLDLFVQVENILGSPYEPIPYHPAEGRRYSIGVSFTGYRTRAPVR